MCLSEVMDVIKKTIKDIALVFDVSNTISINPKYMSTYFQSLVRMQMGTKYIFYISLLNRDDV